MNTVLLPQKHSVQFGSQKIDFDLLTSRRSTLGISVYPDLRVTVTAPTHANLERIEKKVIKKAPWIIRKKLFFSDFLPLPKPKEFKSGESFYYLGRQYRLRVKASKTESVKLNGKFIEIRAPKAITQSKRTELLTEWYLEKAKAYLKNRFDLCLEKYFKHQSLKPNQLIIRKMNNRWGSFTPNRNIILNPELMRLPSHCVDYVIVHEICHLSQPRHNKAFWTLLERVLPHWRIRRKRMEAFFESNIT